MADTNGRRPDRGRGNSRGNGRGNGKFPFMNAGAGRRGYTNGVSSRGSNRGNVMKSRDGMSTSREIHPFGIKKMLDFLEKPNDDVLTAIDRSVQSFKENLSQADIHKDFDMMSVLVQVIGEKLCGDTALPEIQNGIIARICEDSFLTKLELFAFKLPSSTSGIGTNGLVDRAPMRNLRAVCNLYAFMFARMQALATEKLLPQLEAVLSVTELLKARKQIPEAELAELEHRVQKLKTDVLELQEARKVVEETKTRKHFKTVLTDAEKERLYHVKPVDNYIEANIVPAASEIRTDEEPFLRPNLIDGRYPSVLTYLDVQFRLLREDFIAPLREAVKEYRNHEAEYKSRKKRLPPGTIRFYHDVKLKDVQCGLEKTVFSMQFSTANVKHVNWGKSKRLLNGSLVLLTPDNFNNIYFATVACRDERQLSQGIVGIIWEGDRPSSYANVKFLMVECEVYFESYRHTLKALQFMGKPGPPHYDVPLLQTFRMAKYIVDVSTEPIPPPKYLTATEHAIDFTLLLKANEGEIKRQHCALATPDENMEDGDSDEAVYPLDLSKLVSHRVNALNVIQWPKASELGMDEPQYEAFISCITQELSVIQGPPGTGKTYIGLQVMKLLLSNRKILWHRAGLDSEYEDTEELYYKRLIEMSELESSLRTLSLSKDRSEALYAREKLKRLLIKKELQAAQLDRDPILIVCYTNHALDQFLEGILSIMKAIGIPPATNLVRVGGRSKVEQIEKYAIHHRREHYHKYHLFDQVYASARNRARAELQEIQCCRADLKSLYKDLCDTAGVVNFHELFLKFDCIDTELSLNSLRAEMVMRKEYIISEIQKSLPEELWKIFYPSKWKLLGWLGLNNNFFRDNDFDPESQLRKLFRICRVRLSKADVEMENGEKHEDDEEDDNGELKALLEAHRLDEEIQMEGTAIIKKAAKIPYYSLSTDDFVAKRRDLEHQFNEAMKQNDVKKVNEINRLAWLLELEERSCGNKTAFLKELLDAYHEGRVDLPEVTPELLARGHEREPPLKPSLNEKWAIYFHVVEWLKSFLMQNIVRVEDAIIKAQERFAEVNNKGDGIILKKAMVVGLTTTGAAKYNTLLRMMKSRIVIVEEAAEVLESHIVTSLTEHCEHLILIGDHKQLRPPTTVYRLAKDYNLDISLFERLIRNNITWHHLQAQHRMRPEICRLLVPTIYQDLVNHDSVINYPNVRGMAKNLFFINHSAPEKAETDSMSKSNEYEALYAAKLTRYLLLQGYKPGEITVLATYIGQMFLIQKFMRLEGEFCRGVRVTVVDNFQGEENEIIILSLVRSNDDKKIGFLKTDNRICVAISRAKQGMYVLGNMDCLLGSKSKTWESIAEKLESHQSIGRQLNLRCQIHGDLMPIDRPEDFGEKSPNGGCLKPCPGVLPNCEHECQKICHVVDREHVEYKCKFNCQRLCADPAKHSCPHPCWKFPCPPCEVSMMRSLPCGHEVSLPCGRDVATYQCVEPVDRPLPCGHTARLLCYVRVEDYVCNERVEKELGCGHTKVLPCHQPTSDYTCVEMVEKELPCHHRHRMECSADPAKLICEASCEKELPCGHIQPTHCNVHPVDVKCKMRLQKTKADCSHTVEIECWQENFFQSWNCLALCDTRLECGHQCVRKCHVGDDPDHESYRCRKPCAKKCEEGHPCKKNHPCFEECPPCPERIDRELSCGHQLNMRCSTDFKSVQCQKPCERTVDCAEKHPCQKKCFEPCSPCIVEMEKQSVDCEHIIKVKCHEVARRIMCNELVLSKQKSPCGHLVEVPCRIRDTCTVDDLLKSCHHPCGNIVTTDEGGCGHPCQGDCSSCFQGRLHVKCKAKCDRVLACGHVCKYPCSSLCPPCEEKCILRCKHSSCKKRCGVPCNDCRERCKWSCDHKRCDRLCSEICSRDACDEPCAKKLKKCGHDCIGSCGEPCPELCRICDQDVVQELFFGDEDEEDARFVLLEDCGHLIHRESMDKWMKGSIVQDEVVIKKCPKCPIPVTKSVRYGNIIKERLQKVLKIREKIFGNDENQRSMQETLVNELVGRGSQKVTFDVFCDWLQNMLCEFKRIPTKKGYRNSRELKKVDQYTFESLTNMFNWWKEAEDNMRIAPVSVAVPPRVQPRYGRDAYGQQILLPNPPEPVRQDLTTECHNLLLDAYGELFAILLRRSEKLPLTYQEIDDFDQEFERCHDLYRLLRRRSVENFATVNGANFLYNQLKELLDQPKPYDETMHNEFESKLKTLDEILKTAAMDTARQARSTFQAMGFGSHHWYTCQNGHPYVVADCSNFNGAGRCPDCNAPVGSGSSNTRVGNDVVGYLGSRIVVQPPPELSNDGRSQERNRGRGRGRRGRRGRH